MEETATAIILLTNTRESCSVFSSFGNNPVHFRHKNKGSEADGGNLVVTLEPHTMAQFSAGSATGLGGTHINKLSQKIKINLLINEIVV